MPGHTDCQQALLEVSRRLTADGLFHRSPRDLQMHTVTVAI